MNRGKAFTILQYNIRKSRDIVIASLLRDKRVIAFDILAIQEPWRNPYTETTHHPAKEAFHLCYLSGNSKPARTCFFVNKRLDHTK
jgi:hypothetical protein